MDKDKNKNGHADWIDDLIYFLLGVSPPVVFLLGALTFSWGIFTHDLAYQESAWRLMGIGGFSSGSVLIQRKNKEDKQ